MGKEVIMSLKSLAPTYHTRIREARKKVGKARRLLDAGCSDGFFSSKLQAKEVYGIDSNKSDIEIARALYPGNKYLRADICGLPFKNGFFDTVVCIDVLEHVENDSLAIAEMVRVLKKNGRLIITVPSSDYPFTFDPINYILKIFNVHFNFGVWGYGHKRLYDMEVILKKLWKRDLVLEEVECLSQCLVGLFENSYLANIMQPMVKSAKDLRKLKKRLSQEPPKMLTKIRDFIIKLDKKIFGSSGKSLGLLIVMKKG